MLAGAVRFLDATDPDCPKGLRHPIFPTGFTSDSTGRDATEYVAGVLALLLIATSVGLDNFGATTAIGISGASPRLRLRLAVIFGMFEGTMPLLGLLLGHSLAHDLGFAAKPFGGALLGLVGAATILNEVARKGDRKRAADPSVQRLIFLGAVLSLDNLAVGIALGTSHAHLLVAALTIAVVSVALSLLGLEVGRRLGTRLGQTSELLGGAVLMLVGLAVGTGVM